MSYLRVCGPPLQITLKLDLRGNHLQVLPRGAFLHTPYLTHLDLQRCGLVHVKEGAFRTLGRVVSLNLAYNNIDILYQVRGSGRERSSGPPGESTLLFAVFTTGGRPKRPVGAIGMCEEVGVARDSVVQCLTVTTTSY